MNSRFNAKKAIKKRDANRVLRWIAYAAGFPLFVVFVFLGSIPFMNGSAFGATKYYGVYSALVVWAVIIVIQLLAALITKNSSGRAVIAIIATLVVMIGGSVYFDITAEKKLDEARKEYARDLYEIPDEEKVDLADYPDLSIKNYKYQVNSYIPWTKKSGLADSLNGTVSEFMRVYNVGFGSSVKGDVNTDGSKYGAALKKEDGTLEYWFGEEGNVYKENGLYADGYIFGVKSATEILVTYYETQKAYKAKNKDADQELDAALVKAAASKEWKSYKNSDEYVAAYGKNGYADKYLISLNRLEKIVKGLGKGLDDGGAWQTIKDNKFIIDTVIGIFAKGESLDSLGLSDSTIKTLSLDSMLALVNGFLGEDAEELTAETILGVLEPFSNYEASDVKPLMYFIEDETLRTYAYAKYFGEVHGANIGSVLIPSKKIVDGKAEYGNIGHITMSTSGLNYSENAFSLNQLYEMRAYLSYATTMYPMFAFRRYAYVFAGIVALMLALYYYFEMKIKFYAIRLEKMGTLGGVR